MKDENEILDAAGVLAGSIMSHIRYFQRQERERRNAILGIDPKLRKRKSDNCTSAQNFGLAPARDLPVSLPAGETVQTLEGKRVQLTEMFKKGDRAMPVVMKLMKECYAAVRIDINNNARKKEPIENILKRWPFLGMVSVTPSTS